MNSEIKLYLTIALREGLDPYMSERGFARGPSSLFYKRRIGGSVQKLDFRLQVHPKDNLDAAAALYPFMEIGIPTVDLVLQEMIDDNLGLLEGVTAGLSRQPIGFTSVKADPGRWYIYQPNSVDAIVSAAGRFIDQWTMSILDSYYSPEHIVAADERGDERLARDRAQMMRVVAASLIIGRKDYARTLLDKYFGAKGARHRYSQVFEYVENYG